METRISHPMQVLTKSTKIFSSQTIDHAELKRLFKDQILRIRELENISHFMTNYEKSSQKSLEYLERAKRLTTSLNPFHELLYSKEHEALVSQLQKEEPSSINDLLSIDSCGNSPLLLMCRDFPTELLTSAMPFILKALVKYKRIHRNFDGDTFFHMLIDNKSVDLEGKVSLLRLIETENPKVFTAYCSRSNDNETIPLTSAFSAFKKYQDPNLLPLKLELISLLAMNKTSADLALEQLRSAGLKPPQKMNFFWFSRLTPGKKQKVVTICRKLSLLPLKALYATGDYQLISALLQKKFFLIGHPGRKEDYSWGWGKGLLSKWFSIELAYQTCKTKIQAQQFEKLYLSSIKDELLLYLGDFQSLIEDIDSQEENEDQQPLEEAVSAYEQQEQDWQPVGYMNANNNEETKVNEENADKVNQSEGNLNPDGDADNDAHQDGDGDDQNEQNGDNAGDEDELAQDQDQNAQDEPAQQLDENLKIDENNDIIIDDSEPEGDPRRYYYSNNMKLDWDEIYQIHFVLKCIEKSLASSDSIQEALSRPILKLLLNEIFPEAFKHNTFLEKFFKELRKEFFTSRKKVETIVSFFQILFKEMKTRMDPLDYAYFVCTCSLQSLKNYHPYNASLLSLFTDFAWAELPVLPSRDRIAIVYDWVSSFSNLDSQNHSNNLKSAVSLIISRNIDFTETVPEASYIYDNFLSNAVYLKAKELSLTLLEKFKGKFKCIRSYYKQSPEFMMDELEAGGVGGDEGEGFGDEEEGVDENENENIQEQGQDPHANDPLDILSKPPDEDPRFQKVFVNSAKTVFIPTNEELLGETMYKNALAPVALEEVIKKDELVYPGFEKIVEKLIEQRIHYAKMKSAAYELRPSGRFLLPKLIEELKLTNYQPYLEDKLNNSHSCLDYNDLIWCLQQLRDTPEEQAALLCNSFDQLIYAFNHYSEAQLLSLINEFLIKCPETPTVTKVLTHGWGRTGTTLLEVIMERNLPNLLMDLLQMIKDTSPDRNAYHESIKSILTSAFEKEADDGNSLNTIAASLLNGSRLVFNLSNDIQDYQITKDPNSLGFNPDTFMFLVLKRLLVPYLSGEKTEKEIRILLEGFFAESKVFLNDEAMSVQEIILFNIFKSFKFPSDYGKNEDTMTEDKEEELYWNAPYLKQMKKERKEAFEIATNFFSKYEKMPFFFDLMLDGLGIVAEFGTFGRIQLASDSRSTIYRESEITLLRRFLFETAKQVSSSEVKASDCKGYKQFVKKTNMEIPKEADAMCFCILNIDVAVLLLMLRNIEIDGSGENTASQSIYSIELVQAESEPGRMESVYEKGNYRILVQYQLVPSTLWKNCYVFEANTSNLQEIKSAIMGTPLSPRLRTRQRQLRNEVVMNE